MNESLSATSRAALFDDIPKLPWSQSVLPLMPRYFTHVRSAAYSAQDTEGQLFADLGEALDCARRDGRQMISAVLSGGEDTTELEFLVSDELGNHLATVHMVATFRATLHLELPDSSQGT